MCTQTGRGGAGRAGRGEAVGGCPATATAHGRQGCWAGAGWYRLVQHLRSTGVAVMLVLNYVWLSNSSCQTRDHSGSGWQPESPTAGDSECRKRRVEQRRLPMGGAK